MSHRARERRNTIKQTMIHIPIMPDLFREFLMSGHGALAALRMDANQPAFDQLSQIFNVVQIAINDAGRTSTILTSGILAMQCIEDRASTTRNYTPHRHEIAPLQMAMVECETLIKGLDVMALHMADIKLKSPHKQAA